MGSVSDITVAALAAKPTFRGNKLTWTYSDPRSGALPNIALDAVEVWSSTTNDRATATKVGEGITDFTHQGLLEEQTYYYWIKARDKLPAASGGPGYGAWYPSGATSGVASSTLGLSGTIFGLPNGTIVVDTHVTDPTVSAGDLRISIKTLAGTNPSAADPIYASFQNSITSRGSYTVLPIVAALSFTLPSGNTAGFVSSLPGRLWVLLFDDDGDPFIAVSNRFDRDTNSVCALPARGIIPFALSETLLGAGNLDSAGIVYASKVITRGPYIVLGFLDYPGLSVAGVWDILPDLVTLQGADTPLPGDAIQSASLQEAGTSSGTTTVPFDDTEPLASPQEGELIGGVTLSITPQYSANAIKSNISVACSHSAAAQIVLSVYAETTLVRSIPGYVPATNVLINMEMTAITPANGAGTIDYSWLIGSPTAGTIYINSNSSGRLLGGALLTQKSLKEIMA